MRKSARGVSRVRREFFTGTKHFLESACVCYREDTRPPFFGDRVGGRDSAIGGFRLM